MNLEEDKQILRAQGRATCTCKYNNSAANMIDEAIKLQNKQNLQK